MKHKNKKKLVSINDTVMTESKGKSIPSLIIEPDIAKKILHDRQRLSSDGKFFSMIVAILVSIHGEKDQLTFETDGRFYPEENIKQYLASCGLYKKLDGSLIVISETHSYKPLPGIFRLGDFLLEEYFEGLVLKFGLDGKNFRLDSKKEGSRVRGLIFLLALFILGILVFVLFKRYIGVVFTWIRNIL